MGDLAASLATFDSLDTTGKKRAGGTSLVPVCISINNQESNSPIYMWSRGQIVGNLGFGFSLGSTRHQGIDPVKQVIYFPGYR